MTPLERLLAEELPTGTFGDARGPQTGVQALGSRRVTTPTEAAAHYAELAAAIGEPVHRRRRHLRPVPDTSATAQLRKVA